MYSDEQLKQNLSSVDKQLLYEIKHLLIEQNKLLKSLLSHDNNAINALQPKKQNNTAKDDINSLGRGELMGMIKKLPHKPKGWTKWSNDEMISFLKKESDK